jgi:hypothetical protein
MFCHENLTDMTVPANLAFLQHLGQKDDCKESFQTWTHHMQTDFKGD